MNIILIGPYTCILYSTFDAGIGLYVGSLSVMLHYLHLISMSS